MPFTTAAFDAYGLEGRPAFYGIRSGGLGNDQNGYRTSASLIILVYVFSTNLNLNVQFFN